ncbi:homeobox protein SIX3-like [Montipora capricornis]|uniref:homeobox protein SIX3-like n=1 Tax=Montipora capricornis TaxID=246305 RepID=UPI0035F1A9A7
MMSRTPYRARISAIQTTDAETIGKRMKRLCDCNMFAEIERMVVCLPNTPEYNDNENIKRAKISLAWNKKDVQTVYKLIEEGNFSIGEDKDLVELWDKAHCYEAKCSTPLQRYRIRQRFPPPQSICPSGIRRKRGIPRETRDALEAWFTKHGPYPTITDKLILAGEHQLTHSQLKNWFANRRRRLRDKRNECRKRLQQCATQNKLEDERHSAEESEKSSPLERQSSWHLEDVAPIVDQLTPSLFSTETIMKKDINSIAVPSTSPLFTRETTEPSAEDEQLFGQSNVPLLQSQTWDKVHVLSSVNESIPVFNPGKITGATDQATSLTNQSVMSLLPNQTPWPLEHVMIPALEPKLSLSESEEVVHQGYQSR